MSPLQPPHRNTLKYSPLLFIHFHLLIYMNVVCISTLSFILLFYFFYTQSRYYDVYNNNTTVCYIMLLCYMLFIFYCWNYGMSIYICTYIRYRIENRKYVYVLYKICIKKKKNQKKRKIYFIFGENEREEWRKAHEKKKKCRVEEEKVVGTAKKRENIMWIWI